MVYIIMIKVFFILKLWFFRVDRDFKYFILGFIEVFYFFKVIYSAVGLVFGFIDLVVKCYYILKSKYLNFILNKDYFLS